MRLHDFELTHTDPECRPEHLGSSAVQPWLTASVPGEVHATLVEHGLLEHPFRDDHETGARWVAHRTWWYRTQLPAQPDTPGESAHLVFHGLDTVADVWLDGVHVASHASAFRPLEIDVTGTRGGELLIRLAPALAGLQAPDDLRARGEAAARVLGLEQVEGDAEPGSNGTPFRTMEVALRRKPTFSWGWDFGPGLPSVGIWQPVEVVRRRRPSITGWHLSTTSLDVAASTAVVDITVEVDADANVCVDALLRSPGGTEHRAEVRRAGYGTATLRMDLDDVRPWWTHDLGPADLYDLRLTVVAEGDTTPTDEITARVGVRTLELDRGEDPEGGRRFRFVLNGTGVFARGANTIPSTTMIGTRAVVDSARMVELARGANMNMLRVWGGGYYETDEFYDRADALGVLVWQDFMFACLPYPSADRALREEVAAEASHQVRRLRNHPSLAIFAGSNETEALNELLSGGDTSPGNWGWHFFHEVLPDAVKEHASGTVYWPGSPWGEDDPRGRNGVTDGDRHAWEVWHGLDIGATSPEDYATKGEAMHFARYRYDTGKFISEFGIIAAPALSTLGHWLSPEHVRLSSPVLRDHIKDKPKDKGDLLLEVETGLPVDVADWVELSQATQAEGLKFGIEHYRRRQPSTSGTLLWQLNDCWPGVSWSIIDFDGHPKAAYSAVRQAYSPVLASFVQDADGLHLWLTNSSRGRVSALLDVEVLRLDGTTVLRSEVRAEVGPGVSQPIWSAAPGSFGDGPDRVAWVSDRAGHIPDNRLFFARLKDIPFGSPQIGVDLREIGEGEAELTITSSSYAYLTAVSPPDPSITLDRNHVDVHPRRPVSLRAHGVQPGTRAEAFVVRSYREGGAGEHTTRG